MSPQPLPVAILAGGLATRLRPLSDALPKALVDVAGEPFLAHQLRLLHQRGVRDVVLCLGYQGEQVSAFVRERGGCGLAVRFSFDGPHRLGTAGALRRALPQLPDAFLVLYGDSYLPCDYEAFGRAFAGCGRLASMTVFGNRGRWDRSNVELDGARIIAYDKRHPTARMQHIDYGLGAFRAAAFDDLRDGEPADLADLYQALLARGELAAHEVHERFYEVGSLAGLEELRRLLGAGAEVER